MKMLLLDPLDGMHNDGSSIHKMELLHNLSSMGVQIFVVLKNNTRQIVKYNHNLILFNSQLERGNSLFRFIRYLKSLSCVIKKEKLDIMYTRNAIFCSVAIFLKKKSISSVVFEVNGISSEENNMYILHELKRLDLKLVKSYVLKQLYAFAELFSLKHSDAVIAVTNNIKEFLIKKGIEESKIHVIENGANIELFRPYDQKICRDKLGLDNSQKYVCFVGKLAPWQGVEYLIKASTQALKNSDIMFLIVGDGVSREGLEKHAFLFGVDKSFLFLGKVPYEQVPLYINASDICVVPKVKSLSSGYSPLKLYEYLACGKPVIATNTFGFEFLETINAGILVDPENTTDFAKAILRLLEDKDLSGQMGKNGFKYVRNNRSWNKVAEKTIEVFKSLGHD